MKQQCKIRPMALIVAALVALGGLVVQSHSAYAGGGMSPPGGPRSQSVMLDPADIMSTPHGISTRPGRP
jgi:hypothetical protein